MKTESINAYAKQASLVAGAEAWVSDYLSALSESSSSVIHFAGVVVNVSLRPHSSSSSIDNMPTILVKQIEAMLTKELGFFCERALTELQDSLKTEGTLRKVEQEALDILHSVAPLLSGTSRP